MKSINYDQVCLVPNYSEIRSRDDINTDVEFLGRTFKSPALPANMAPCINYDMACSLSENEYFYIMHRFDNYDNILKWIHFNQDLKTISISIGVKDKDKKLIDEIYLGQVRVDFITIDVSHGWHISVKEMIDYIKSKFGRNMNPKIIAGNVMTHSACVDLLEWGADAVKVGLSQGKSCSTYAATGVGQGMFSTVLNAQDTDYFPMIADGAIREAGDICKSLVAGATMTMIGSEFARCKDSPAEMQTLAYGEEIGMNLTKPLKVYYGSASARNKGYNKYVEGFEQRLPMRDETYFEYLDRIGQGIRSCMSYAGARNIKDLTKMSYILK